MVQSGAYKYLHAAKGIELFLNRPENLTALWQRFGSAYCPGAGTADAAGTYSGRDGSLSCHSFQSSDTETDRSIVSIVLPLT